MDDFIDDDDDDDEAVEKRKKRKAERRARRKRDAKALAPDEAQRKLAEVYDPTEIEQHMLTEADNLIRSADVPERLQSALSARRLLTELELHDEAEWIYSRLFSGRRVGREHDNDVELVAKRIEAIERVLTHVFQGEQVGRDHSTKSPRS